MNARVMPALARIGIILLKGKYPVHLINRVGGMLLDPVEVAERTKKILEVK